MSYLFNANELADEILRKISAFSINDSAADPNERAVALNWLDLNMAERCERRQLWWLVPETVSISLTSGNGNYVLDDLLGALAPDGFAFPINANLKRDGNELPLTMIPRYEWDAIQNKDTEGTPSEIHIDRQKSTILNVYPVPNEAGLTINLTFQSFAPNVREGRENTHGLRAAWQRWAIYKVAADVGDGTIRKIPNDELKFFEAKAKEAWDSLLAFGGRENRTGPRRVARVDY